MNGTPFFNKPCPTCARMTQIKVSYLGRKVSCQHCGRNFVAADPDSQSAAIDDPVQYWINFTEHQHSVCLGNEGVMRHPR